MTFAFCGFLGLPNVWGQTDTTPSAVSEPLTPYTNKVENVSFLIPKTWNLKELNQKGQGYFICAAAVRPLKDPLDGFGEMVNLVVADLSPDTTLDRYMEENIKNLNIGLKEFKVEKKEAVNSGNAQGKYLVYSHQVPTIAPRLKMMVFLFVKNNKGYALTCTSTAKKFSTYEEMFQAIGKSFKFNG
jgi:hypothetical protein